MSDLVSGAPRYRLTYTLGSNGVLKGAFAVAPPGTPDAFVQYLGLGVSQSEDRFVRDGRMMQRPNKALRPTGAGGIVSAGG